MKLKSILYLPAFFIFLVACKKKNDSPVIIVTPDALIQYGNPGDIKDWNISITSDIRLSRLIVYTQIQNSYEQVYKDTALSTKNLSWKLQYLVPSAAAGKLIYFRFRVIDDDGNESIAVKEISVGDQLLVEVSALQFFTRRNASNNAFDLEKLEPSSVGFADSTQRDLQEFTSDTASLTPSYYWFSPAGGKFVYVNSYDYGNATLLTAQQTYENSTKFDITDSLIAGKIYITKLGSTASPKYVVLKLVSISNDTLNNPDYYTFNVKR